MRLPCGRSHRRVALRMGFFRKAHALWNCLACHLVVDDTQKTLRFTFGLPSIVTVFLQTPQLPAWLGGVKLAGGVGERAEYGLWHDYHETKLQWRRIIDRSGPEAGKEYRQVHEHHHPPVARRETLITPWVAAQGEAWAKAHGIDRWRFTLTTWRAQSSHWWIPALYDHYFILSASRLDGQRAEATAKVALGPHLEACKVFDTLTQQIQAQLLL